MKQYARMTQKVLRQLGVNGSYAGFHYTVYGIVENIKNPELIVYICKGLYAEIATQFHVNVGNVERNIRTVVSTIWEYGDREFLNEIFGKELNNKPKNTVFIDVLSEYILDICEKVE